MEAQNGLGWKGPFKAIQMWLLPDVSPRIFHPTVPHILSYALDIPYSGASHRSTEWVGLEGTFQDHLVQPPAGGRDTFRLPREVLDTPSMETSDVRLDRALRPRSFTILTVNNFLPMCSLNLSTFNLKPLSLIISLKCSPHLSLGSL